MQSFCDWLSLTWLSQFLGGISWWLVPVVQTVHILAIAATLTLLLLFNVRLLRNRSRWPAPYIMADGYLPWVWRALVVLLLTGIVLTLTEPARELMNVSFRLKMLFLIVLIALLQVLRRTLRRDPNYWSVTSVRRWAVSAIAVTNLTLCVAIVTAGRLIAYV